MSALMAAPPSTERWGVRVLDLFGFVLSVRAEAFV